MIGWSMPKKRKQVVPQDSPSIPYQKYRVHWIDILSDSGWAEEKEFNKMKLTHPINEGWLYSKDRDAIKLFASYDKDDDGSFTFGDRTMIPLAFVKKMIRLK